MKLKKKKDTNRSSQNRNSLVKYEKQYQSVSVNQILKNHIFIHRQVTGEYKITEICLVNKN